MFAREHSNREVRKYPWCNPLQGEAKVLVQSRESAPNC